MKWSTSVISAALLVLGTIGIVSEAKTALSPEMSLEISRGLLSRQIGSAVEVSFAAEKEKNEPEITVAPMAKVTVVEEAWDEELRKQPEEEVPAAEITIAEDISLSFRNETEYEIDIPTLPALRQGLAFSEEAPCILIMHTHGTEGYVETADSGYRTQAEDLSVLAVGDVIADGLQKAGFSVIHDKTLCDYPEYTGAYTRSREVIQNNLEMYPGIQLVLDIHRDAVEDADGNQMRMAAGISEEDVAQLMLVVGTDAGGLEHPQWRQNLSFSVLLQSILGGYGEELMRPLNLRRERFNQDLAPISLLVEVGASGNSQAEAERSGTLFAKALSELLNLYCGKSS